MALPAESGSVSRGWRPESRVAGRLRPPGSKSIAQRALLAAACVKSGAATALVGLPSGEDVQAALAVARALGARVTEHGAEQVRVAPGPPAPAGAVTELEVGESGTLARLVTALCGLNAAGPTRIQARGTLRARRSDPLLEALRRAGCRVETTGQAGTRGATRAGAWPLTLVPPARIPEELHLDFPVSSQEVSGLWLAAAVRAAETRVTVAGPIPSAPYLAITHRVLAAFGAELTGVDDELCVRGPLRAPPAPFVCEADASSAAVALAAGCLSGGRVEVEGIPSDSAQGDARIVEHLSAFGCAARREGELLVAEGPPLHGAELDLARAPDLAPVLAVVAAAAGAPSLLTGLGTLRGKESDRIAALADGLSRAGFAVATTDRSIEIAPGRATRPAPVDGQLRLDPQGDHRMVFAFALAGLLVPGVSVADPGCVAKSWPGFWEDLAALGAREHDSDGISLA